MRTYTLVDGLVSLCPTAKFEMLFGEYENLVWNSPEIEIPTKEQALAEAERLNQLEIAKQYQFDRLREYPSIADQLDLLYHIGYDGWKAAIQEIKDKYPKL